MNSLVFYNPNKTQIAISKQLVEKTKKSLLPVTELLIAEFISLVEEAFSLLDSKEVCVIPKDDLIKEIQEVARNFDVFDYRKYGLSEFIVQKVETINTGYKPIKTESIEEDHQASPISNHFIDKIIANTSDSNREYTKEQLQLEREKRAKQLQEGIIERRKTTLKIPTVEFLEKNLDKVVNLIKNDKNCFFFSYKWFKKMDFSIYQLCDFENLEYCASISRDNIQKLNTIALKMNGLKIGEEDIKYLCTTNETLVFNTLKNLYYSSAYATKGGFEKNYGYIDEQGDIQWIDVQMNYAAITPFTLHFAKQKLTKQWNLSLFVEEVKEWTEKATIIFENARGLIKKFG
jgi:hypothetical protein